MRKEAPCGDFDGSIVREARDDGGAPLATWPD